MSALRCFLSLPSFNKFSIACLQRNEYLVLCVFHAKNWYFKNVKPVSLAFCLLQCHGNVPYAASSRFLHLLFYLSLFFTE